MLFLTFFSLENCIRQSAGCNSESFDQNLQSESFVSFVSLGSILENLWRQKFSFSWFMKIYVWNFLHGGKNCWKLYIFFFFFFFLLLLFLWIKTYKKWLFLVISESLLGNIKISVFGICKTLRVTKVSHPAVF